MRERSFPLLVAFLFPALIACLLALVYPQPEAFGALMQEDTWTAWLSIFFWLSAALGFFLRWHLHKQELERGPRILLWSLFAFTLFATLEELNWGQRIIGFQSPAFMQERLQNAHFSLHYLVAHLLGFEIKFIAGSFLMAYGLVLPIATSAYLPLKKQLYPYRFALALPTIAPWFLIAALLVLLQPVHHVEELAELMVAGCFFLIAIAPQSELDAYKQLKLSHGGAVLLTLLLLAPLFQQQIALEAAKHEQDVRLVQMHHAVYEKDTDRFAQLLHRTPALEPSFLDSRQYVMVASSLGNLSLVQLLLQSGASVHVHQQGLPSAVHYAVQGKHREILFALLEAKADPNHSGDAETTPLIAAIQLQDLTAVKTLLSYNASANLKDSNGRLPLVEAAKLDFAAAIKVLLAHGANRQATDGSGAHALAVVPRGTISHELLLSPKLSADASLAPARTRAKSVLALR